MVSASAKGSDRHQTLRSAKTALPGRPRPRHHVISGGFPIPFAVTSRRSASQWVRRPAAPGSPGRRASSPAFGPSLAPLARSVIAPANRAVRRACPRARFALSRPEGCRSLRAGPCRVAALPERPRPSWGPWVSGVERLGRGSDWGCSGHSELSAASRRTRASVRRVRGWRGL